jgi:hypothetical protein
MLFHMQKLGDRIEGWVSPDNPSTMPRIRIFRPDGTVAELDSNVYRPDVRDAGLHPTGKNGFDINSTVFPDLAGIIDQIEIRDFHTGVLLYRPFDQKKHLSMKVLRFDVGAMPYAQIESLWNRNFALYYNAAERYPLDTMFGVLNNPVAQSLAISGRIDYNRYEHFFRERNYKIITLLRPPLEEMAERLLFIRYALAPQSPASFDAHLTGLRNLASIARGISLDRIESVDECFAKLTNEQKIALSNPVTKALCCAQDEVPRKKHIQLALSKLSTMDLVGVSSRYGHFSKMLSELLGRDLLAGATQPEISWTRRIADRLATNKRARSLVSLDLKLYELAEKAIERAISLVPNAHARVDDPNGRSKSELK